MKRLFLFLWIALFTLTGGRAQETPTGDVTLEMADKTTKRGWSRTEMVNEVKFFEISDELKGQRIRYDNDQIARIVFDDGAVYVKRDLIATAKGNKTRNAWVRIEHEGKGIALYSVYREGWEQVNTTRRKVSQRNYFIALGNDNLVWAATDFLSGGTANRAGFNRSMLNYYFSKRYAQYADFAKRVKAKEFNTKSSPIEVVRAWEESYGNK